MGQGAGLALFKIHASRIDSHLGALCKKLVIPRTKESIQRVCVTTKPMLRVFVRPTVSPVTDYLNWFTGFAASMPSRGQSHHSSPNCRSQQNSGAVSHV